MVTTSRLFSPGGLSSPSHQSSPGGGGSSTNKKRNLSSSDTAPISVEAVSILSRELIEKVNPAIAGCVHGKWACAVLPEGRIQVWNVKTCNVSDTLEPTQETASIYLTEITTSEGAPKPLVALNSRSTHSIHNDNSNQNSVNLWVLDPASGWLVMKTVTRKDLSPSRLSRVPSGPSARTRLVDNPALIADEDGDALDVGETFQYLSCRGGTVVVGTSKGKIFWVTYTAVPPALHLQKVEPPAAGMWSRWFTSDGGTADAIVASTGIPCQVLPLSTNSGGVTTTGSSETVSPTTPAPTGPEFLSLSTHSILKWSVEQQIVNSGHHATFHPLVVARLASNFATETNENWTITEIVQSTLSFDEKSVHFIARASATGGENSSDDDDDEPRLYWIVVDIDGENGDEAEKSAISKIHWIDRFPSTDQLEVQGMVSCENGIVYVAVSDEDAPAVVLFAMLPGEDAVVEEDVLRKRQIPSLLPGMIARDIVTHGCYMVASTGLGVRARCIDQSFQESKRPRLGGETASSSTGANKTRIKTLASHLKSYFWKVYGNATDDQSMPPSLRHSDQSDLQQAILSVATELQKKHQGEVSLSSLSTAVQWHTFFVDLIQQGGLYRSLSEEGKWKMFGIGQETTVFAEVAGDLLQTESSEVTHRWCSRLKPYRVADWLLDIQSEVFHSNSLSEELWHMVLATAAESILVFRDELAEPRYDLSSTNPREKLWTSQPAMMQVLQLQLDNWRKKQDSGGAIAQPHVESVVKASLSSFSEAYDASSPRTDIEKLHYVKQLSVRVLRNASEGNDQLAFDLCVQHDHFQGICEISVANEKNSQGPNLSIDPLFSTITATDLLSGYTFAEFVLQWHTDKDYLGHVINYGRHAPELLKRIINKNKKLQYYQWIPAIRNGFYGNARDFFLDQTASDIGLKSSEWSLSMARLTNKLVVNQNHQTARDVEKKIDLDLEMVNAQKALLNVDTMLSGSEEVEKKSPEELFEKALEKLDNSTSCDDRVGIALTALSICNSMGADNTESLSRIWSETLLLDMARWSEWTYDTYDLATVREEALEETVFGRVLEECRRNMDLSRVKYGRHIETSVLERAIGDDNRESFTRLLRAVAAPAPSENLQVESLTAGSFF